MMCPIEYNMNIDWFLLKLVKYYILLIIIDDADVMINSSYLEYDLFRPLELVF